MGRDETRGQYQASDPHERERGQLPGIRIEPGNKAWEVTKDLGRMMGLEKPYAAIRSKLRPKQRGDAPIEERIWNLQYARGQWDFLEDLDRMGRYAVLENYIRKLDLKHILDIGCGQGILLEYLKPYEHELYVGIDLSKEALKRAAPRSNDKTHFIQADGAAFNVKPQTFDAVMFSESLYYLHEDPRVVLDEYIPAVKPQGRILTSLFETKRIRKIHKDLKKDKNLELEHETTVSTVNKDRSKLVWHISVWKPTEEMGIV